MRLALFLGRADMFSRIPANLPQHLICKVDGFLIRDGRNGIVPAVQIPADSDHGEDLDNLDIGEMLPHFDEIFWLGHIGRDAGRHRQAQGCAFRIGKQIGRLKAPQRLNLFVRNADLVKVIGTMRLAMSDAYRWL